LTLLLGHEMAGVELAMGEDGSGGMGGLGGGGEQGRMHGGESVL
jgi:hypothetical protein